MLTLPLLLIVAAFVCVVASMLGKAPLSVAVLLLVVYHLLTLLPV